MDNAFKHLQEVRRKAGGDMHGLNCKCADCHTARKAGLVPKAAPAPQAEPTGANWSSDKLSVICARCSRTYGDHSRDALTSDNEHGWRWAKDACPIGSTPFHPTHTFLCNHCSGTGMSGPEHDPDDCAFCVGGAAPAETAAPEGRVQCKCGVWFDKGAFEAHVRTCGAREMTAEQFLNANPSRWSRQLANGCLFWLDFAEAYAKLRVEQAERETAKVTAELDVCSLAREVHIKRGNELAAKVSDLERERDNAITLASTAKTQQDLKELYLRQAEAAELKLKEMREALRNLENASFGISPQLRERVFRLLADQ